MAGKIAVVTGANRGLGLEACRQLGRAGLGVILTARNEAKGREAVQRLQKEGIAVQFHSLDVSDTASVERFCQWVTGDGPGRVDVLINNAGIMIDTQGPNWDLSEASAFKVDVDVLRRTMEANVYGHYLLCQKLIPMMVKNRYGRVVNLSSGMGQLTHMNGGWPAYRLSKVAMNVLTRVFADETRGSGVLVNSVAPGWVKTDMGGEDAQLTPEEGVKTIIWAATLPDDGPSGKFFEEKEEMEW